MLSILKNLLLKKFNNDEVYHIHYLFINYYNTRFSCIPFIGKRDARRCI